MNILHINSYYSVSPFYKNIFDYQRKNNTVIVYVHTKRNFLNSIKDSDCIISSPYNGFDRFLFHRKHRKIWNDLKSKVDFQKVDIIHAHSLFSNGFEAYKAFMEYGTPYIVAVRNTDVNVFLKHIPHLRSLGLKIMMNAKAIVFLSHPYKDYVLKKFIPLTNRESILRKTYVITNGIDDFWIKNKSVHQKNPNMIKAISVGVVNKNKNHLSICKALKRLCDEGYCVSLDIYGKVANKRLIKKIGKYDFVKHFDPLPKEQLIYKYRECDVFALPSITETFGLVYPEAMSQGLPVIYSKGQGFDGQYNDGRIGCSVYPKCISSICDAILSCFKNYDSISNESLKCSDNYSWIPINKTYIDLYNTFSNDLTK